MAVSVNIATEPRRVTSNDHASPLALVLGATGLLGRSICTELANRGYSLALVARDAERLRETGSALLREGANVISETSIDLRDFEAVATFFRGFADSPMRLVVVAHGLHAADAACLADPELFRAMIDTNFASMAVCAEQSLALLEDRGGGELIVVSSVSGDRGRARNFRYASTKAALNNFLEGLRLSGK